MGCLGTFADLSLGLLVIKVTLGVLLGPPCAQPGSAQAATHCGLLCSYKLVAQVSHMQHLIEVSLYRVVVTITLPTVDNTHERAMAIKTQFQQEVPKNPHMVQSRSPQLRRQGPAPLDTTGHLKHKATLARVEVRADLPNMQK